MGTKLDIAKAMLRDAAYLAIVSAAPPSRRVAAIENPKLTNELTVVTATQTANETFMQTILEL
jgi:hypothetical protein